MKKSEKDSKNALGMLESAQNRWKNYIAFPYFCTKLMKKSEKDGKNALGMLENAIGLVLNRWKNDIAFPLFLHEAHEKVRKR